MLYRSDRAGAVDISVDVTNPDVIYAAIWEAWRRSWGMSSGGEDSGLYKSTDGGESWTEITANIGLAEGPVGKIGVAVSPANPDRVWALIEHEPDGGVWRSEDGGESWERVNEERKLRQRAFYYTRIYADPNDEDVMYALNTGLYRSRDGGETFPRGIQVPHGDNHDLWIAPRRLDRMINANDGGANVTFNGGESWTDQDYSTAPVLPGDHHRAHAVPHLRRPAGQFDRVHSRARMEPDGGARPRQPGVVLRGRRLRERIRGTQPDQPRRVLRGLLRWRAVALRHGDRREPVP